MKTPLQYIILLIAALIISACVSTAKRTPQNASNELLEGDFLFVHKAIELKREPHPSQQSTWSGNTYGRLMNHEPKCHIHTKSLPLGNFNLPARTTLAFMGYGSSAPVFGSGGKTMWFSWNDRDFSVTCDARGPMEMSRHGYREVQKSFEGTMQLHRPDTE